MARERLLKLIFTLKIKTLLMTGKILKIFAIQQLVKEHLIMISSLKLLINISKMHISLSLKNMKAVNFRNYGTQLEKLPKKHWGT